MYTEQGDTVWSKFNAPVDKILWFNGEVFLSRELEEIEEIRRLGSVAARAGLELRLRELAFEHDQIKTDLDFLDRQGFHPEKIETIAHRRDSREQHKKGLRRRSRGRSYTTTHVLGGGSPIRQHPVEKEQVRRDFVGMKL